MVAAVSGGADSIALALAIAEVAPRLGLSVAIATVDHGLRPGSADEVKRVEAWARQRGLPMVSARVNVEREGGLEAAARRARYAALERLADELDARWIATAHTATDQAETVLLRLSRGAGARGARGVLPRRGRVLRPLLGVTRPEIERFLAERGEAPLVDDPSNQDLARSRNRIRHRVLPELRKAMGQGADRALARFATLARDDEAALAAWANGLGDRREELREVPAAVLRRWLRAQCEALGLSPNESQLQSAAKAVHQSGAREVELGRKVVVRAGERVLVAPVGKQPRGGPVELPLGEARELAWAGLRVELAKVPHARAAGPLELALPLEVALPLSLRPVAPGDRLQGERGTVRVKRLLVDRKVPRAERSKVPVLVDAHGTLLWVVGHRVAASVRAGQGASPGLLVRVTPIMK
ncbi:MAG: tRNA lysidine(34) synthetase TilS [Deltaproteobacteria bacterium]|nr:tRNA lysidine(34) synthetase TilS [Deltaproteobacteria bacterium]